MSTISGTLKMFDAMSGPLKSITSSMNLMVSSFEKMQASTDKNLKIDKSLIEAKKQIALAESGINRAIEDSTKQQEKFNRSMERGEKTANGLLSNIKGFVSAYLGIAAIRKGTSFVNESLGLYDVQSNAERQLQVVLRNVGATEEAFTRLSKRASELQKKSLYGDELLIGGGAEFATYISDDKAIESMMKTLTNYAAGMSGGGEVGYQQMVEYATQLGKALGGTYDGLKKKGFELSDAQKKIIETGTDMQKALVIDEVINQSWAGLAEQMANTPSGKIIQIKNALGDIREEIGKKLYPNVMKLYETIEKNMPGIQSALFGFAWGVEKIIWFVSELTNSIAWVGQAISQNWGVIEPLVWGIAGAVGAWLLVTKTQAAYQFIVNKLAGEGALAMLWQTASTFAATWAAQGLTVAWAGLNTVMKANVIIAVIGFVIALIAWIYKAWKTNDDFAAGLMRAGNSILNFFGKMGIWLSKAGVGIAEVFYNIRTTVMGVIDGLINYVIDGINKLINKLNKIPGVSIEAIGKVDFSSKAALEAEAVRQANQERISKLEQNAALLAHERELKVQDMLAKREQARQDKAVMDMDKWDFPTEISRVGEVGKINGKVDISSEDLKLLRELAEMKNIQNFVTLTPSVTVQTGDITNGGFDIEAVVSRITDTLEQQIASSAEGILI